jgi:prepilin-type N-terminal cleavage/methylation domain-containing protein
MLEGQSIAMDGRKNQNGFSLIELIMTILIIGLLAAVATARYINLAHAAKTAVCKTNQMSLESAQRLYYSKNALEGNASYATDISDLLPYISSPTPVTCSEPTGQLQLVGDGSVTCVLAEHKRH